MDILTFITEMAKAFAWPAVAFSITMLFRSELRVLLHRVKKGKVGVAEFEFEATVSALRDRAGKPDARIPKTDLALINQATQDPKATILNSWLQVQGVVSRP